MPKYKVRVQLSGEDGNPGAIMGRVSSALKEIDAPQEEINAFRMECFSGDYDHLLRTCMKWVEVS